MSSISTDTVLSAASDARVLIRDGFVWDAQDVYLFDIDGTLLRSRDRIHYNSFAASVRQVTGHAITLSGVGVHGGTDTAILREAMELAGIPAEAWVPQREAILEAMRAMVLAQSGSMDLWTMPAAAETLAYLTERGALLGLGTGNLERIGWAKVELVGLRDWFHFGGFSDRFEVRSAMVADAAAQARALWPKHLSGRGAARVGQAHPAVGEASPRMCVVGDTPRDIEAARANGLAVIAVATGQYGFDELVVLEPEVCATSLAALMERTVGGTA